MRLGHQHKVDKLFSNLILERCGTQQGGVRLSKEINRRRCINCRWIKKGEDKMSCELKLLSKDKRIIDVDHLNGGRVLDSFSSRYYNFTLEW